MTNASCIFCKILRREAPAKIVFEDEWSLAFEDLHPQAPVHILIIPKKHIVSMNEGFHEDEALIGHLHRVAARLARQRNVHQSGYRLVMNTGPDAGQSIFHIHLHLLGGRGLHWPPG